VMMSMRNLLSQLQQKILHGPTPVQFPSDPQHSAATRAATAESEKMAEKCIVLLKMAKRQEVKM
jgi:hypothetical protein